jgi:hypothetical protein
VRQAVGWLPAAIEARGVQRQQAMNAAARAAVDTTGANAQ